MIALMKITEEEFELIDKIVSLTQRDWTAGPDFPDFEFAEALALTHLCGCKIDLKAMLETTPFNRSHDLVGICRHIDWETGQLKNHFRPRMALREGEQTND